MKRFRDWSIRSKLVLPLVAVVAVGGGGIILALSELKYDIIEDVLPEARALDGIRDASHVLLSKYREFMIVQSDEIQREIDEQKAEIRSYVQTFERVSRLEPEEARFVPLIQTAVREFKRIGDETIALRIQLMEHIEAMGALEARVAHIHILGPAGVEATANLRAVTLAELTGDYLSELRDYLLAPNDATLREIAGLEGALERIFRHATAAAAAGDDYQNDYEGVAERIRRLLQAGRASIAVTSEFQSRHDDLEAAENALLAVLDEARLVIAEATDAAFDVGFASVAGVILAVLVVISLAGYAVAHRITKPVAALARAAGRLGAGDLDARTDIRSEDEIGVLATNFNDMARRLQDFQHALAKKVEEQDRAEATIRASLDEKEVLLKEIHHRVKNNLQVISSMLSLQASAETDPRCVAALNDSEGRVRLIARLYETLYRSDNLNSIGARDYLTTVVEDTLASSGAAGQDISWRLVVDDIAFGVDDASACGQIVCEAVSNSLKHAFADGRPGNIEVSLRRRGEQELNLRISDDGKGFADALDPRSANTLGIRLIHALAMQLGGEVKVDGSSGTCVEISFPEKPS